MSSHCWRLETGRSTLFAAPPPHRRSTHTARSRGTPAIFASRMTLARAMRNGARAQVTTGTQRRDFLHVVDAASAFADLLSDSMTGAVNIGSGVPISVRAVVEILARAAGRPDAVDFGAVPMQPGEPPMI